MLTTLELRSAGAVASVVPARGALVTSWVVGGRSLLYLDETTLHDPEKNVRGGIPVLFPSPGKLRDDSFARGGATGRLKQHGFARNRAWELVRRSDDALTLALVDDADSRAAYPFAFRVELEVALSATRLVLRQRVVNRSSAAPLPFGFGFHPYFALPLGDKVSASIETRATRAFDNVTKQVGALGPMALGGGEVDLHLLDHPSPTSALGWGGERERVRLRASSDYRHWVVWTLPDKPFVCLEPWTCPGDALNSGDRLIELAPGASWSGEVEFSVAAPGG